MILPQHHQNSDSNSTQSFNTYNYKNNWPLVCNLIIKLTLNTQKRRLRDSLITGFRHSVNHLGHIRAKRKEGREWVSEWQRMRDTQKLKDKERERERDGQTNRDRQRQTRQREVGRQCNYIKLWAHTHHSNAINDLQTLEGHVDENTLLVLARRLHGTFQFLNRLLTHFVPSSFCHIFDANDFGSVADAIAFKPRWVCGCNDDNFYIDVENKHLSVTQYRFVHQSVDSSINQSFINIAS